MAIFCVGGVGAWVGLVVKTISTIICSKIVFNYTYIVHFKVCIKNWYILKVGRWSNFLVCLRSEKCSGHHCPRIVSGIYSTGSMGEWEASGGFAPGAINLGDISRI